MDIREVRNIIILKENKKKRKARLKVDAGHPANMRGKPAASPLCSYCFFSFFTKKRISLKTELFFIKINLYVC
jgi:hypothetical protein